MVPRWEGAFRAATPADRFLSAVYNPTTREQPGQNTRLKRIVAMRSGSFPSTDRKIFDLKQSASLLRNRSFNVAMLTTKTIKTGEHSLKSPRPYSIKALDILQAMLWCLNPLRFGVGLTLVFLAGYPIACPAKPDSAPLTGSDRQLWQQMQSLVLPSVSCTDATLTEILNYIRSETGRVDETGASMRIRCEPASLPSSIKNVVTLDLRNVPLKELLDYLSRLLDLEWRIAGGEIVITKATEDSKAEALFASAAAGNAEAQFNLGFSLWEQRNYAESAKWMRKAADQGSPHAQTMLGTLYAGGNGVAQSDFEAAKWFSKAADSGDAYAQLFLADAYSEGRGVPRNQKEAARLMEEAAAKNNPEAQATLGWWCINGINTDIDVDRGMKLLREAAAQGNEEASAYIARLESTGSTVFLSKPVEFPATINGKTVGVTTAPPGSAVKVIKREAGKVCIQHQKGDPVWVDQSAISEEAPVKEAND